MFWDWVVIGLLYLLESCGFRGCLIALLGLLAGCQNLELDRNEIAWQTIHLVDVAQTLNASSDPCYIEDAWLTAEIIGEQPSEAEVLLWGVGTAILHVVIANVLEDRGAPQWLQKAWDYGTITYTGYAVKSNYNEGVRMFGANQDVTGCNR